MIRNYILETPQGVQELVHTELVPSARDFLALLKSAKRVYFVGCGTSFHAGLFGKYMFEKYLGVACDTVDALEFVESIPDKMVGKDTPVVLISHTGRSDVTLEACRRAKELKAPVLALCGGLDTPLGEMADAQVSFNAIDETVGPKTKGYTLSLVALLQMLSHVSADYTTRFDTLAKVLNDSLSGFIAEMDSLSWPTTHSFGQLGEIVVVGGGVCWSVVHEMALKLIEIARINSVGYYTEHMRHGASYSRDSSDGFICIIARKADIRTAVELSQITNAIGSPLLVITAPQFADQLELRGQAETIVLSKDLEELIALESTLALQLFAYSLAKRRGLNLDEGLPEFLRFKTKV